MTNVFIDPAFSPLQAEGYYAGLTSERYRQEKRQMAETIIRELRPNYLTVENEPKTTEHNTKLPMTVQTFTQTLQFVLDGLDRSGVLVGAGAGSWDDPGYMESLARNTSVDYLDLHVYPINRDFLVDRAFKVGDIARRHGKRLVIGEAWLYKAADRDLGGAPVAAAPGLFARDVFSFWEPLDVDFLIMMGKFAHLQQAELISFFWSRNFFGYVDYDATTRALRPPDLYRLVNRAAAKGMMAQPPQPTRTGLIFQQLSQRALP
jgi:hypothetical protein